MPWFWWVWGVLAAGSMWWLAFHDTQRSRRPLAAGLAIVYTACLLAGVWVTACRRG